MIHNSYCVTCKGGYYDALGKLRLGMGLGWIYMIIFWGVVITAVVYLVKFFERKTDTDVWHETPLDELKRRYAKGEITREEFEGIKHDLKTS
jgi:putative membrane protein